MRSVQLKLVAAVIGIAAVAMGGASAGSAESPASGSREILRVGVADLPPGRGNPYNSSGSPEVYTSAAIFDTLTKVNAEGVPEPMLADSWSNTSPTTWEFVLRAGVTFSNGEVFDSTAVVNAIEFLIDDPEGSTLVVANDISSIESVSALDSMTVEIVTATPDPVIPNRLAGVYIPAPVYFEEAGIEAFAEEPVGSGPYQLVSWGAGSATLTAFEDSWRAPQIPQLEIVELPDPAARLQGLQSGQVDVAVQLSPDQVAQVESSGGVATITPAPQVMSVAFITERGETPLASTEVRQALNYAVDKQVMVDALLLGEAAAAGQGATPAAFGYDPSIEPYPYDPEMASQLLADAGYPDGFSLNIDIVVGSFPGDAEIYTLMEQNLEDVGVDVELRQIQFSEWLDRYLSNEWGDAQAFGLSWNTAPPLDASRPMAIFSCLKSPAFFCDESVVPMLEEANAEMDPEARAEDLSAISQVMRDNPPALYLVEQIDIAGMSAELQGFESVNRRFNYDEMSFG